MKTIFLLGFVVLGLGCGLQAEPPDLTGGNIVFEETQVETPTPVVTHNNCVTDIVNLPCGIYCIQIGEKVIWFEIKSEDFGPQFYPGGDPRFESRF